MTHVSLNTSQFSAAIHFFSQGKTKSEARHISVPDPVTKHKQDVFFSNFKKPKPLIDILPLRDGKNSVPSLSPVSRSMLLPLVDHHREVLVHWLSGNVRFVFVRFWLLLLLLLLLLCTFVVDQLFIKVICYIKYILLS